MLSRRRNNKRIKTILSRARAKSRARRNSTAELLPSSHSRHPAGLVPYNRNILARSRTQLQLGEWNKLADLDQHELEHNPAAAELQLLAAAGHLQKGGKDSKERARTLIESAMQAGMDRESVARILVGGACNTLARIAALSGRPDNKVFHHFRSALSIAAPDQDADLLLQPAATRQLVDLAKATRSGMLMDLAQRTILNFDPDEQKGQVKIDEIDAIRDNRILRDEPVTKSPLEIPLELTIDGQRHTTQLVPNHPEAFKLEGSELVYELPDNRFGFLVTNQAGDYKKPSSLLRIQLKPNAAYELNGHIPISGEQNPVFWFFEYANGKRSASASFPTKDGAFTAHTRTSANLESINFGIRLGGKGRLETSGLHLQLRSGSDVEITQTLQSQLEQLGSNLETALKKNQDARSQQNLSQLESFMRLQNYLGSDFVLPEMHGWAISPDFGVLLINLLEEKPYDAVIEFGSGVSTVIVARILQKQKQRNPDQHTTFVSFDHLEQYFNQTRQQLETAGVLEHVQLELTPLVEFTSTDQRVFQYYDCVPALKVAIAKLKAEQPRVLVLVDGPPAATGEMARYPALPSVLSALPEKEVTVELLLDDYRRQDEKTIVAAWIAELDELQLFYKKTEYDKMEKESCFLRVIARGAYCAK